VIAFTVHRYFFDLGELMVKCRVIWKTRICRTLDLKSNYLIVPPSTKWYLVNFVLWLSA